MISQQDVKYVAALAKLELSEKEMDMFAQQLGAILDHFQELSTLNTDSVEPLITPTEMQEHLREDESREGLSVEQLFQNAPEVQGHLFKVPPVI